MATFLTAEFEVLGRLTHEQRRFVRAWLRETSAFGECGAQARTAKNCRASKWRVHRAVRRFKRIVATLGEPAVPASGV